MDAFDLSARLQGRNDAPGFRDADDARIHILWIEDKPLQPRKGRFIPDWFSIIIARTPQGVLQLRDQSIAQASGEGLPPLPADVYLTDFRLHDNDSSYRDPDLVQVGGYAPAAGFVIGILTALNFPDRTQHIVPYSAYDEEFGPAWTLVRRFAPDYLSIAPSSIDKKGFPFEQVVRELAEEFRDAIKEAILTERNYVTANELDRLIRLLDENVNDGKIAILPPLSNPASDNDPVLTVNAPGRVQRIALGSLFFDHLGPGANNEPALPDEPIRRWLEGFSEMYPHERPARALAAHYWAIRHGLTDPGDSAYIGSTTVVNAHDQGVVGLAILSLLIAYWTHVGLCAKVACLDKRDGGHDLEIELAPDIAAAAAAAVHNILISAEHPFAPLIEAISNIVTPEVAGILAERPNAIFRDGRINGVDVFGIDSLYGSPLPTGNLYWPWGQNAARTPLPDDLDELSGTLDHFRRKPDDLTGLATDARDEVLALMVPGWSSMVPEDRRRARQNAVNSVTRNVGVPIGALLSNSPRGSHSFKYSWFATAAERVALDLLGFGASTSWPPWID